VFNAIGDDASSSARVATDGDGDAILLASFSGEVDFDLSQGVDARQFDGTARSYFFEFDAAGSVVWNRAINGENCYLSTQDLAVSRETIAVRAFVGIDCVIDGQSLRLPSSHHLPLLAFTRQGVLRDALLLGGVNFITGLLAYDDGSVVASGAFTDEMSLGDPGTVIASESTEGSDFMLRFSKDSRLQWLKVFPVAGRLGHSIARTPEGGVLGALGFDGSITSERYLVSWRADGTAAWTGGLGCTTTPRIASNGDWFMLKTENFGLGACDLEPGPGSEPVDTTPYLVRYHF
jgi:hypothetical protein